MDREVSSIEEKQEDFKTWCRASRRDKNLQKLLGVKSKRKSFLQEISEL